MDRDSSYRLPAPAAGPDLKARRCA
jgi:hypothetical protein